MSDVNHSGEAIEPWLRDKAEQFGGRALIVGKGPSYAELDPRRYEDHFIVALNEAAIGIRPHAAFVIDEDILLRRGTQLLEACREALIVPHVLHAPRVKLGGVTLYLPRPGSEREGSWREAQPWKLRTFNLSTSQPDLRRGATYHAFSFSAPTVINLLARNGFRQFVLAGIDGGRGYADDFHDVDHKKLQSVQDSFDVQFSEFRSLKETLGVTLRSVRSGETTILIGAEREQALADAVLRWSIVSRSFLDVRFVEPKSASGPASRSDAGGTPFSFQRLHLPALSGWRGRGVYLDSDMLVFRDVYELFNADMRGNVLLSCRPAMGRAPQYSVFLVDNARARWDGNELERRYVAGEISYQDLIASFAFVEPKSASLPAEWNSLEHFEPGRTANLHFTDMNAQPWLSTANANMSVWCEALFDALDCSADVREAFARSMDQRWIRPSLGWQVEHRKPDVWSIPRAVRRLDAEWAPPHLYRGRRMVSTIRMLRWWLQTQWRGLQSSPAFRKMTRLRQISRKVLLR